MRAAAAPTRRRSRAPARVLVAACVVGLAWFGSGLRVQTWPATLLVLLTAVGAVALTVVGRRRTSPNPVPDAGPMSPRLRRAVVAWTVLVAVGLLWEAYAYVQQPGPTISSPAHPTLSTLLDPLLEARVGHFVGWLLWLAAGSRLVRP